jgi:BlaI family transcriptional regulator, penicillinase repressor
MARTPQDVTNAELAVLQLLWELGPANRRQLTDRLYPGGSPAHYTTVQKLLERLEAKGYVAQEDAPGLLTFKATISRDDLISRRLLEVAEKLCEGSVTPLLINLVRSNRLSAKDLRELRALIDALRQHPQPKRPPR